MRQLSRLSILILFIVVAYGSTTAQSEKPLYPIYDKEKNVTTFFLSPVLNVQVDIFPTSGINLKDGAGERPIAGEALKLVTYIKFIGKSYSIPNEVTIAFESYHYRTFQYTVSRNLDVTTPGRKYAFGQMNLTGRRSEGVTGFFETLELSIPVAQYRELITSKRMEGTLGGTSFSLNADQLKSLRGIAEQHLK